MKKRKNTTQNLPQTPMAPPIYFHPHILNQSGRKRTHRKIHTVFPWAKISSCPAPLKGQKIIKSTQSLKVGLGPESRDTRAPVNTERIWTRNGPLIINVTILCKMGNPFLSSCRVLCWCYSSASKVWSGQVFQIIFYLSICPFPVRSDLGNACQDSPEAAAAFGAVVLLHLVQQDAGKMGSWSPCAKVQHRMGLKYCGRWEGL